MTISFAIDGSHRIGFSKCASLHRVHLKNLVIFVKLDYLQILQLPVLTSYGTLLATVLLVLLR